MKKTSAPPNPDLMYEMEKYLKILFEDQQSSRIYKSMMKNLKNLGKEAKNIEITEKNAGRRYIKLHALKYKYFQALREYVPKLLRKEEFFKSAFL